jgi:hypothetical protein
LHPQVLVVNRDVVHALLVEVLAQALSKSRQQLYPVVTLVSALNCLGYLAVVALHPVSIRMAQHPGLLSKVNNHPTDILYPCEAKQARTTAFCGPRLFGPVMQRSNSCARIGGHCHAVDDQTVRRLADSSALIPAYSL